METFNEGDRVRITRPAFDYENGWQNTWVERMNEAVGKIGIVTVSSYRGLLRNVSVHVPGVGTYGYPDFVLRKVKTAIGPSARAYAVALSIAEQLGKTNLTVNAAQVQRELLRFGFDSSVLGNAAGQLFRGKNWRKTGRTVKSDRSLSRGRRINVWRFVG